MKGNLYPFSLFSGMTLLLALDFTNDFCRNDEPAPPESINYLRLRRICQRRDPSKDRVQAQPSLRPLFLEPDPCLGLESQLRAGSAVLEMTLARRLVFLALEPASKEWTYNLPSFPASGAADIALSKTEPPESAD
ncbi:hypothetical protein VNO77_46248 [Canavalia gladiata]|uniref:Transmembrane protein n=1 Tax=Canavalia gladiata TaxID=3824 RepID=A0AAN9JE84_CANGL